MRLFIPSGGDSPMHLAYCLNIHPGETWRDNLDTITTHALRVRDAVAPDEPFALGLRLSDLAARQLAEPATLDEFRNFMDRNGLYVFTINGFPYGPFHHAAVKAGVYQPDWRTPERRDYTIRLIDILAALLPEGISGSISTVPGSYGAWIRTDDDVRRMADMLGEAAAHAAAVLDRTGRDICIALEPEPDCFIETTAEAIEFLTETLPSIAAVPARHVGVCFDTAHLAVQFEDLADSLERAASAGVRLGKVQLSAALRLTPTAEALKRLGAFVEPVYLHQVKARHADGRIESFADLPEAIAAFEGADPTAVELRVHFHVPLFFTGSGPLGSTGSLLCRRFWRSLAEATNCLEIETYTFDVLPAELRACDVVESIRREYAWVLAKKG